jgi:uracil-DNA glycosylase family 4
MDPLPTALATCDSCPRLVAHREAVAHARRRSYRDQTYWGKPVPGFGDPAARIVLLGLAPGAHGSNRTGRMFTGDASGDFLFPALHRAGFANRSTAISADDGLRLDGVWITASARCVPPGNKPTREELANCRPWLEHDFRQLPEARLVVALGSIGHDSYLDLLRERGARLVKREHPFGHGTLHRLEGVPGALPLLDSYHPSFQNTNTGRLTSAMFDELLRNARAVAGMDGKWR